MQAWIRADRHAMAKRYVRSERHTMQVDFWRYIRAIRQARQRGAAPAGAVGRLTAATEPLRRRVTAIGRGRASL
jgi:hypothetical protein